MGFVGSVLRRLGWPPSGLVAPSERLARFHFSKGKSPNRLAATFMPPADLQLSVYRIDGLSSKAIWALGAGTRPNNTLRGRADILAGKVNTIGLSILPDGKPRRHAAIVGWPEDISAQQLLAMKLVGLAVFKPHP